MAVVDVDPELKGWVRDFIHKKERVTVEDVRREFFPDEIGAPYLYLDRLVAEGVIKWRSETGVYAWTPTQRPKSHTTPPKDQPEREPSEMVSHKDCLHPKTKYERQKCRYSYYKPGTLEREPSVAQILKAAKPKPTPKPMREARPKPDKPQLTPEEAKAKRKRWNGGSGLTTPVLAHHIYKRMRANRHRQYVFSREWLYRQYPGVAPEMVDAALQRLVDTGRISALPK
ncbi:hypothetical protein ACWGH3_31305 [Streptomyces sp. NPDC054884]